MSATEQKSDASIREVLDRAAYNMEQAAEVVDLLVGPLGKLWKADAYTRVSLQMMAGQLSLVAAQARKALAK